MDKFLLAENPMRPESGTWIVHLLSPQAHIKCTEGHERVGAMYRHYTYKNTDGLIEEWTLSIQFMFTQDFTTPQEQVWETLLDRAWRWYRAYMEWEDNNLDIDNDAKEN